MHSRPWKLGRPIKLWIFPLRQPLLLLYVRVVALVWQVVRIVANLLEGASLGSLPVNSLGFGRLHVLAEPLHEVGL